MVIASSAALVAEYTEPVGSGVRPASELILIMLPPLSPNSFNDSLLRLLHLLRQTAWRPVRLYPWKRLLQGLLYLLICSLCQSILVRTTKLGRHSVAALSILTHTGLQFRPYPAFYPSQLHSYCSLFARHINATSALCLMRQAISF